VAGSGRCSQSSNLGCSLGEFGEEGRTFNGSVASDGVPGRTLCALVSNLRKAVAYTTVFLAVGVTDSSVGVFDQEVYKETTRAYSIEAKGPSLSALGSN